MLEKFLTMPQKDFSELLKASPQGTDRRHEREAYRYAKVCAPFSLRQGDPSAHKDISPRTLCLGHN